MVIENQHPGKKDLKPERVQEPLVPLEPAEVEKNLAGLGEWSPAAIVSTFPCHDFVDAARFVTKVASVATAHHHYPKMVVENNQVQIFLATPGLGLTQRDFDLAKAIEEIA